MNIKDYKIKIITSQLVPQNIGNPIIEYICDDTRKHSRLLVEVFYKDIEIGRGIILDFYKKFEIIEWFGTLSTKALNQRTEIGQKVFKLKFYKDPPVSISERNRYLNEFCDVFSTYVTHLKEQEDSPNKLCLSCIPSSSKIPDDVVISLSTQNNVEICNFISKNISIEKDGKNEYNLQEALELAKEKYIFQDTLLQQDKIYIVIDDVFGVGASMITILKKLYDTTQQKNYFLVIAKDVKR